MEHSESAFYVTVGRGTESFAEKEIRRTLSAEILSSSDEGTRDGKIFFLIKDDLLETLEKMLKLKSVERVFVAISNYSNKEFFHGKRLFLNKLMSEMSREQSYSFAQLVLQQLTSLSLEYKGITSKRAPKLEFFSDGQPVAKKAKLDNMNEDLKIIQRNSCTDTCPPENFQDTLLKHSLISKNAVEYSFRLSIKCSGKIRKWLQIKKLSKDLSWRVAKACGWTIDLRNPSYEICLHINDEYVTAGIPLTRTPLSRRRYVFDPGLRGPIAWIMTNLAKISDGDVVLDPMCGKGTLLLEACCEFRDVHYIGVDKDFGQLSAAINNSYLAGFADKTNFSFMHADALYLPLKCSSINVVVCDAPFNQKYFTSIETGEFYFSFLCEMNRVLQTDGNLVLLTSEEISDKVTGLLHNSKQDTEEDSDSHLHVKCQNDGTNCMFNLSVTATLRLVSKHNVKLGETLATILLFKKESMDSLSMNE